MLLIGYGNPGRGDDGLGPRFVERIAAENLPAITCLVEYQLNVEHALMASQAECVIFADATLVRDEAFTFTPLHPRPGQDLASHTMSPATVIGLAQVIYGSNPEAHVMAIAGYDFDTFSEDLSERAARNLDLALAHFRQWAASRPAR